MRKHLLSLLSILLMTFSLQAQDTVQNASKNKKEKIYNEKKAKYIKQAERDGKLDDIYVLSVYVDTTQGLRHIIRTIRESGYINQCVWGRC